MAETLAYASLLSNGYDVRLSGQDMGRGTFAHRHAVLHDQDRERWDQGTYIPLQHVSKEQGDFVVIDSVLSEEAVLGFEYGFSTAEPNALVIWEAQFGDFANGAQVVFDQFISSGERKWLRMSGLVCLLPHGYEGQGPEHSSARLERFLQLCADNNLQVVYPTTPAQMFHVLRRQMKRTFRKPLIVMTPKSLLRHKLSVSAITDLAQGRFMNVIDELDDLQAGQVRRVVFCSGRVYFDLLEARRADEARDVALVRIEQLYPFPAKALVSELSRFPKAEVVWAQEEPRNMGAWFFIDVFLQWILNQIGAKHRTMRYAGRPASASTAVGQMSKHLAQLKQFLDEALG